MAEKLLELGQGIEIWRFNVDEAKEQDVNANAMPKPMFDKLQETIKKDSRLEQLPFLAVTSAGLEIVSGHHRIRAARAAGVAEVYGLVDVTGLTPDQIRAKQLAHNAIQGTSNEQLVARIYGAIQDVNARLESFIDPRVLGKTIKISIPNIELGIDYRVAVIMFLPHEKEKFDKAAEAAAEIIPAKTESVYTADVELFEKFKSIVKRTGKEYDIRALGTVLDKVAEIVLEHLGEDHGEGSPDADEWVALRDVVGFGYIPKAAAEVLTNAIENISKAQEVTKKNRWQALEYLAADYLSGAK